MKKQLLSAGMFMLTLLCGGLLVWGAGQYLKSDGTPDFQKLKSTANGNKLTADMRDDLMDGLSKIQQGGSSQPTTTIVDVPKGAVMAFNLSSCPQGWSRFAEADGRFIMGGDSLGYQRYETAGDCKLGYKIIHRNGSRTICESTAKGGDKEINLTISQLPSHYFYLFADDKTKNRGYDHRGNQYKQYSVAWENNHDKGDDNYSYTMAASNNNQIPSVGKTNTLGSGQAIDIQNPYIKLLYCQKN